MKVSVIIPVFNSEKTIRETLESVLAQRNVELEVICIDDCSSDDSIAVIREVAKKDERVILLINSNNRGVSYSRNRGIDIASGEYVRFCDADDLFPKDSTQKMLSIAEQNKSDLVVGIMEGSRGSKAVQFASTSAVAKKKNIDKYDPLLIRSFSVCNKMFRMKLIRDNDIRFREYKHAEDGLFLYEFLSYANTLNGCDCVVYTYLRPATFMRKSASVNLSKDTLQGILDISDNILKMHPNAPDEFYEAFNKRILSATLLEKYYIRLWHLNSETMELLKKAVSEYRKRIPDNVWHGIEREHPDLMIDKMLYEREEVSDNALFTIVVSDSFDHETLQNLLGSLYFQKTPFFKILYAGPEENIDPEFREKTNLQIVHSDEAFYRNVIESSPTPYISFISDPVMFSFNSLAKATEILEKERNLDYVTGLCQRLHNDKLVTPVVYRYAFKKNNDGCYDECTEYDKVDSLISNKIFRTDALRRLVADGLDPMEMQTSELADLMTHGRYRAIRYILDYSDAELKKHLALPEKKKCKTQQSLFEKLCTILRKVRKQK